MKTIKFLVFAIIIAACGSETKQETAQSEAEESETAMVEETSDPIHTDLTRAYLSIKDALIAASTDKAAAAAKALAKRLNDEAATAEFISASESLAAAEDIEKQREVFKQLTENFIAHIKANGSPSRLYIQYCPMAFNNTGASWISDTKQILNPYFGDKMLKCGKIQETIN